MNNDVQIITACIVHMATCIVIRKKYTYIHTKYICVQTSKENWWKILATCYALEGHIHLGRGPHPAWGRLLDSPALDHTQQHSIELARHSKIMQTENFLSTLILLDQKAGYESVMCMYKHQQHLNILTPIKQFKPNYSGFCN